MSPIQTGLAGIGLLMAILFFMGMPVGFAMTVVGFAGFSLIISWSAGMSMIGAVYWETFSSYGLTVIPLFIFMGQIAFYSGVNKDLYHAAHTWTGHIRGGVAMATIMACSAFSAICGSNAATAATMSTVALPEMKKYRYHPRLSTGAVACGSTLGVVIPPSVVLIVIGLSTQQSIARLFCGGIGAGILLTLLLAVTVDIICRRHPDWGPVSERCGWSERIASLSGAAEMLALFALVMSGLYFGFFTPAEAGAAGSFLALGISLARRRLSWKGFRLAVSDTLRISCMVITIVAGAMVFGRFLAVTRIPFEIAEWVVGLHIPGWAVMGIIFGIYIIGGAFMDALALLLITIPIFFPVARELGYDPVWFGVIITVVTTLGAVTPPVGATTYVVGAMAEDTGLDDVFKGVAWFIPAYILCIFLLTLFPWIITYLPARLNG